MKENIPGYHITKDGKVYTHKKGSWKLLIALVLVVYE